MAKVIKVNYAIPLLSVNKAWQGRRFKSADYIAYENELLLALPSFPTITGFVEINYTFYTKNFSARDIDNLIKPLQDILVKKGYIANDNMIVAMIAKKVARDHDSFRVEIYQVRETT